MFDHFEVRGHHVAQRITGACCRVGGGFKGFTDLLHDFFADGLLEPSFVGEVAVHDGFGGACVGGDVVHGDVCSVDVDGFAGSTRQVAAPGCSMLVPAC